MRNLKSKQAGYTIVELLAVVSILVIVSSIIAALITQTLRGSSKSRITNEVSQAGNYAASVISSTIIEAEDVVSVGGVAIENCTDDPTGNSIVLQMPRNRGTVSYECTNDTIASNSASLIDDTNLKAEASACYFTCSQRQNDPYTSPIINFGFTISQKGADEDVLFESQDSAPFETSVFMRNYNPR